MDVTLSGMATEVRELQSQNAPSPMVVTPLPIVTFLRELQLENA
jgi:hypothetical protein